MSERLFIAIGFEEELCHRLEKEVKKVKINLDRAEIGYKWVPAENYHVTLVFLGNTTAEIKDEVIEKLHQIQDQLEPFELLISGVDAFGSERDARLVYCGVQNKKALRHLVDQTRDVLGMPADETYSPHLSIARLRNPANIKDIISPVKRKDFFKVKVSEIRLYKSILAGPYPVYKVIERIPFKNVTQELEGDELQQLKEATDVAN
jgi:RNA 2',3'-cyclic 3'-phosphodiesterase